MSSDAMASSAPTKPETQLATAVEQPLREPWRRRWGEPIVVVTLLALVGSVVVGSFQALKGDIVATEARLTQTIEAVDTRQRQDLKDLKTEVKADIADLRAELKTDVTNLRTEVKADIADLKTELKTDVTNLRTEVKADIADLRAEFKTDVADIRTDNRALSTKLDRVLEILYAVNLQGVGKAPPLDSFDNKPPQAAG